MNITTISENKYSIECDKGHPLTEDQLCLTFIIKSRKEKNKLLNLLSSAESDYCKHITILFCIYYL